MENKNLTFEQANELLEKTFSKMESGELTLEQTMEEYVCAFPHGQSSPYPYPAALIAALDVGRW